jgi:gamma-glutamyltranspeptidase/glutathione hydrolase
VVDAQGNAVSVTTTINDLYGSGIVVSGAGYLLNNEMDDFSAKPGVPNLFGMVGGEANAIEPGKRMLSSMTPVVVLREGELFLVAGSPGGSTIITSVLQTVLNTTLHGMSLRDATAAPKFHSQWLPDEIVMEQGRFDDDTRRRLEALGHRIREVQTLGRVDAIRVLAGGWLEAVGDPRGDNTAAGYKKR